MSEIEQQIIDKVKEGIGTAIANLLQAYNSPLNALIQAVVASRSSDIRSLIEESIDGALSGDFRKEIKEACTHKLARVLISKMEGEIERQANELRQSSEFKAKVTLAIADVVKSLTTPERCAK